MKPIFHPFLVNDPFGDPALYINLLFDKRALMFDLGDINALPARKLLRISHVFISHTHMDHFIGFDHLLRIRLGREKHLYIYGPAGFLDQLQHKLSSYTWNLVQNYENDFTIYATEYHQDGSVCSAEFHTQQAFKRTAEHRFTVRDGLLLDEPAFQIRAVHLDHRIPCLAFCLQEKQHINIWKNKLDEMGLPTGPWLRALKNAVFENKPADTHFNIHWQQDGQTIERCYTLGELSEQLLSITPGQKLGYIVDCIYNDENQQRIMTLIKDADQLYIEAGFLQEHRQRAQATYHLTAAQAGTLARLAQVKRLNPFHFSTRYQPDGHQLINEAEAAFNGQLILRSL